ncbi:Carboxylesterase 5A [Dermatophagoides pteronyssinus]|uniref:Carboxylesterase 5A n=1 Tax=Dermatophagoides pteronyssinus TaxID=6956 RepID=A0ABQ8ITG5_DERPT|nr:Carboxylesterase 5A [Dermatophagoides pteronyssinus]
MFTFFDSSFLLLLLSRFLLLMLIIFLTNNDQLINCQSSSSSSSSSSMIEIQTELGSISGIRIRTYLNNRAIGFMGIPYALPPISNLRFKKPIPYPKWYPKTIIANGYKPCCPQLDINGLPHGQEDCLYLNVFVPLANIQQNSIGRRFPVMVYIQGESFENGDAALYGPEHLLDWDVIVVTFNYRLGVLGFLSTGDEHGIGNWGLYDQLLVLRWIHDHIESFGGDPNQVTLFGQGAGASSAILHLISPLSTGLFNRVIAQSGSPLCSWSMEYNPANVAIELGRKIGCPIRRGNAELIECLRRVKLTVLLKEQQQGKIFGEYPHQFVPVVEEVGIAHERLVPNEPRRLISQGHYRRIPLMMGYNKDETSFLYPLILNKQMIGDQVGNLRTYLEEKLLPRFIRATILLGGGKNPAYEMIGNNAYRLKTTIKNYEHDIQQNILFKYFNFLNSKNYPEMALRFVNMSTDALYGSCIDETLRLYSAAATSSNQNLNAMNHFLSLPFTNITYKYVFGYRGRNSMLNLILQDNHRQQIGYNDKGLMWWPSNNNQEFDPTSVAVCHGDELFYLFNLKFSTRKPQDNRDALVQRRLLLLWTDFAKHGFAPFIPSLDTPFWPPYTIQRPTTYLIDEKLSPVDSYHDSATHFWIRYLPSISSSSISSASIIDRSKTNSKWHPSDKNNNNGRSLQSDSNSISTMTKLRTFAWSMLALSLILFILIIILMLLLFHQRRRQSFSAETSHVYNCGQTSAKTLAHVLASRRASLSSGMY